MRVATLIDVYSGEFIGGGQVHVKNLAFQLEKQFTCHSIIFSQPEADIKYRFLWSLTVIPMVIWAHKKRPFSLIHSHGYIAGFSGKILSLILGIPVVHTVHGSNLLDIKDSSWKGRLEKYLLTDISYDAEISVSQSFLQYKTNAKKVVVIPNGVTISENIVKKKPKNQTVRLLFVGRLEVIKGLDYLLKALAEAKKYGWQLRLVGDGEEKKKLKILTHSIGIASTVKFLGKKTGKDLEEEYQKADLFVLPSLSEGLPLTVLEAWAHKLPVLVTRVGHNPYMVVEDKNGFVAEPGSVESLKKALIHAFEQKKQLPKMGERGYELVKHDFTWKKVAQQTFGIYEVLGCNKKEKTALSMLQ